MMVYTSPEDMIMPVVRCPNHMSASDPINQQLIEAGQIENVIWTTDLNGKYEKNMSSGRVSIVTDYGIPHIGSNFVTQIYKFSCMGSCTGGTNRRSTAIIFTLEYEGQVIGRQALNCRICSCPKRDKKAQEKNFMKNSIELNPIVPTPTPPKKMIKLPSESQHTVQNGHTSNLFLVPIRGYENYMAVKKFAEYLDNVSRAHEDAHYSKEKSKFLLKHNRKRAKLDVENYNEELVIGQD